MRKTTLVVRKTLSSIFELSEKKVREIDQIVLAVFSKENSTFPDKIFDRKLFFPENYVFFHFFRHWVICSPSLCWKFAAGFSKDWSGNPTKIFVEESFFFKIVYFCNFCRHRFSLGLSAKLLDRLSKPHAEFSAERYQQEDFFRAKKLTFCTFSNYYKKIQVPWQRRFLQVFQIRNLCVRRNFLRKHPVVVEKHNPAVSDSGRNYF